MMVTTTTCPTMLLVRLVPSPVVSDPAISGLLVTSYCLARNCGGCVGVRTAITLPDGVGDVVDIDPQALLRQVEPIRFIEL